jgi:CheY-like chemotaxis protein
LTAMNRQVHHMVRLIDDLLEISRINNGMLELKLEPVDLRSVIDRAVEIVRPISEQRAQAISIRATEPLVLSADPTRVIQIVGNLLHNASKYTPVGGQIELELVGDDNQAIVRVIDHGVGIPTDQLAAVFEMFAKIKRTQANANNGLGIGLALARRLATMHGGSLMATSDGEGRGTIFTLSLPRTNGESSSAVVAETVAAGRPLRIVVIEDNQDGADLLVMWLEQLGHHVELARTGFEGLALVGTARPEVVLCDVGLPDVDGIEVCRRIKELHNPPTMVALTGWGMDEDRRRTKEAGFDHHLVKPVALEKLRIILSSVNSPEGN